MRYAVRAMQPQDIPEVIEVEKEAFPTIWPSTPFRRELENKRAGYLVAWEKVEEGGERVEEPQKMDASPPASRLGRWVSGVRHLLGDGQSPPREKRHIVGFAGLWFAADESHLVSIAVREALQRSGIGELLLISSIELAVMRNARFMTLEVRASNLGAQALYEKYGFAKTGVRRGYYTDNREDALIMSTDTITSASYQANFQRLKQAHFQRWGEGERNLT